MDIEQYTAAAITYSVDDYYKKLVTNHSVNMYTRLLSYHSSNEVHVNHYAFCFLQRMVSFRLEQTVHAPAPPPPGSTVLSDGVDAMGATSEDSSVTLGHLLFNVNTLMVFNDLIADAHTSKQKAMEPLLRLVKSVIRRFGEAAHKNHMLYVEALFQHPHAHDLSVQIDNVYEASVYVSGGGAIRRREDSDDSDDERDVRAVRDVREGKGDKKPPKMNVRASDSESEEDLPAPRQAARPRRIDSSDEEEFDDDYAAANPGVEQGKGKGKGKGKRRLQKSKVRKPMRCDNMICDNMTTRRYDVTRQRDNMTNPHRFV